MLQIYLFGNLRISLDTIPWEFSPRPKTGPLLGYLLLHRQNPVPRDALAYTLWPDASEKTARANLRRHLYGLKQALPPTAVDSPWVVGDHRLVQWNPEASYWLDLAEFERLRRDETTLADAAVLYVDDLLPRLDEEWLFYERERFRDSYFLVLSQLIVRYREQNSPAKALLYARELLKLDPFREDALRQLMVIIYETGNRASALVEYERFAQYLREELDVDPMLETQSLYQQILRNRHPDLIYPEVTKDPGFQKPARQIDLAFAGYEAELERLRGVWHQAAQQHGQVLLLGGEAGVGKTRLVNEFSGLVDSEGVFVLYGTTAFSEPLPYQAVIEALQPMLSLLLTLDIPELWLAVLLPVFPQLQVLRPDLVAPAALDVDQEQVRLFDAIVYCLTRLASEQPLLLILEDLHWAGQGMLAILEFLAHHIKRHSILVIATYREEELPRMHPLCRLRQRLRRDQSAKHLTLNGISYQAVTKIAQSVFTRGHAVEPLARRLYTCSEGNPLFIQELINDWFETSVLGQEAEFLSPPGNLRVPKNLQELLQSRLEHLTSDTLALAEIIAVIGLAFDVELVRVISGWNEGMVLTALDELMDQHLIRETGGGKRFDYCFTHQLIQAVILDAIPAPTLRRRHRRAAQVMEEFYPQNDALAGSLAIHFEQGGLGAKAADYTLLAAQHALSLYADEEALSWVRRGLHLSAIPRIQWDLLMIREAIYHRRGERAEQHAVLDWLAQLAVKLDDPVLICHLLERQIIFHEALDEHDKAAGYLAEFAKQAELLNCPSWRVKVLQLQAEHFIQLSRFEEAFALSDEALTCYRASDDTLGQARCYRVLARIAMYQNRLDLVLSYTEQVRSLAEAPSTHVLLADAIITAASAAISVQVLDLGQDLTLEALALCRQIGYRECEAHAHDLLGVIAGRHFKVKDARHHYIRAAELYAALGKTRGQAAVILNLGVLKLRLGYSQEVIAVFEKAKELFVQIQDKHGMMISEFNLGNAAFSSHDHVLTRAALFRSLALARELNDANMEAKALSFLSEVECELGNYDDALAYVKQSLALRNSANNQMANLGNCLGALTMIYLGKGDLENAIKTTGELIEFLAEAEVSSYSQQKLFWIAALACKVCDEFEPAVDLLNTAYELLQMQAAAIPDDESRALFLRKRPSRRILAAYHEGDWTL